MVPQQQQQKKQPKRNYSEKKKLKKKKKFISGVGVYPSRCGWTTPPSIRPLELGAIFHGIATPEREKSWDQTTSSLVAIVHYDFVSGNYRGIPIQKLYYVCIGFDEACVDM